MTDTSNAMAIAPDATECMAAMRRIAEKTRRVAELWLSEGGAKGGGALPVGQGLANDFMALSQQLLAKPMALAVTDLFSGKVTVSRPLRSEDRECMQASSCSRSEAVMQNIAKWAHRLSMTRNLLFGMSFCLASQPAGGKTCHGRTARRRSSP